MTELLPDTVSKALAEHSAFANAASFGLVAVALLLAILIMSEALRVHRAEDTTARTLSAVATPLLLCVLCLIGARLASFMS